MIDLGRELTDQQATLRAEALARLARGLDVPPEVMEGTAQVNHWGSAQISNELVTKHVAPVATLLADFLTHAYLRPMLVEFEGVTDPENFELVADLSPITARADEANSARALHDRAKLSDAALRRANGFDDDDAPDLDETVARLAVDLVKANAALAPVLLPLVPGFENVDLSGVNVSGGQAPPQPVESDTDATSGQEPPVPEGDTGSGLAVRLAVAADAVTERALERAGARVLSKVRGNPQVRERLSNVARSKVLAALTPSELAATGETADTLLAGAWEPLDTRAREWVLGWLEETYGDTGPAAVDTAAAVASGLCADVDRLVRAHLHRPMPTVDGLRVPVALVAETIDRAASYPAWTSGAAG